MSNATIGLGDIIEIISPDDDNLHRKVFYVSYLDNDVVILMTETGEKKKLFIEENNFKNKSIDVIRIIDRSKEIGFALQHKLIPKTWIDIHFDETNEVPFFVTGEIVNLVEDQIEIHTVDGGIIYIDFAFQGIPLDLPINSIKIRSKPNLKSTTIPTKTEQLEKDELGKPDDSSSSNSRLRPFNWADQEDETSNIEGEESKTTNEDYVKKILEEGDKTVFGKSLGTLEHIVDLPEEKKRFSLENQTKDMLDDMLSVIPNDSRTPRILNKIHLEISRFEQLRNDNSVFDNANNAIIKRNDKKPLAKALQLVSNKINYILPVIKTKKKLYDVDDDIDSDEDTIRISLAESRINETDVQNSYMDSTVPHGKNKYKFLQDSLNLYQRPQEPNGDPLRRNTLTENVTCVVNNFDDFHSTVANDDGTVRKRFFIQTCLVGDEVNIESFLLLPKPFFYNAFINLNNTNILRKADLNIQTQPYSLLFNEKLRVERQTITTDSKSFNLNNTKVTHLIPENVDFDTNDYLNRLTPSIVELFDMVKDNVSGNVSIKSVVDYLEPFAIYNKNISYPDQVKFDIFNNNRISEYKKEYNETLASLNSISNLDGLVISGMYRDIQANFPELIEIYGINEVDTNSIILRKVISKDCGNVLNSMYSIDTLLLSINKNVYAPHSSNNEIVIAKSYGSTEELENDNGMTIYYDAQYDNTNYDIINDYKEKLTSMDETERFDFLYEQLNLYAINGDKKHETMAILQRKRKVEEGVFALVKNEKFIRKDNVWIKYVEQNDVENLTDTLSVEFENRRKLMLERHSKYVRDAAVLSNINNYETHKYDAIKRKIGSEVRSATTTSSPFEELRDMILGEEDFVKRQHAILKFTDAFARKASPNEDIWWYYCIDTSTKLLPTFFRELAVAYTSGSGEDYVEMLKSVNKIRGTISDDESCWVDKYSGYNICPIAFDSQEGYTEEGFKIKSRDFLDTEYLVENNTVELNPMAKSIKNVANSMAIHLGIDIQNHIDFILMNTYEQLEKEMNISKKKSKSTTTTNNISLIIKTLSFLIVSVQTSIPRIKRNRKYPGCDFSLTKDKKIVQYVACVASKIKSSILPWKSIYKWGDDQLYNELTSYTKVLRKSDHIKRLINKRKDYDKMNPASYEIAPQNTVWYQFLPLLSETEIGIVEHVTKSFVDTLYKNVIKGSNKQHKQVHIVRSKIILYAVKIQELITSTVKSESPLLYGNNGNVFLENSCCNDGEFNTYEYFSNKENTINEYNAKAREMRHLLTQLHNKATAPILFNPTNTRTIAHDIFDEYTEDTIYRAIIYYCGFQTNNQINPTLMEICGEKPEYGDYETINEHIQSLKRTNHIYDQSQLSQLMSFVNRNNILNIEYTTTGRSNNEKIRETLIDAQDNDIDSVDTAFIKHMTALMDTFDLGNVITDCEEMRNMKNYLATTNGMMRENIVGFLQQYSVRNDIIEFIDTIDIFGNEDMETNNDTYSMQHFMKNAITNLARTFPNIVLNEVDYTNIKIPIHWKLSKLHESDIGKILNSHYSPLRGIYHQVDASQILNAVLSNAKHIDKLAKETYFLAPVIEGETKRRSIFDKRLTKLIFKFYLFSIFTVYIDAVPQHQHEYGVVRGSQLKQNSLVTDILVSFITLLKSEKNNINFNHDKIMIKVNRSKNKERSDITESLKHKTDEERRIEKEFINNKLEKWSKGLQKGLRIYQKDTYDDERKQMERQKLLDIKINRNGNVTDMNRNIYEFDMIQGNIDDDIIDKEVNDISLYVGEDDDHGDMDGDESF